MAESEGGSPKQGWPTAIGIAAVAAVVAFVFLVYVPNLVVTRWTSLVHSARVGIATSWFFVALFGLSWLMRALQKKGLL